MDRNQSTVEVSNAGKLSAVRQHGGAGERVTSVKHGEIHALAVFLYLMAMI